MICWKRRAGNFDTRVIILAVQFRYAARLWYIVRDRACRMFPNAGCQRGGPGLSLDIARNVPFLVYSFILEEVRACVDGKATI